MPRAKSKPTAPHDWAHELQSLLIEKEVTPSGDGWLTSIEFAAKIKKGRGNGLKILRQGLETGLLERFVGTQKGATRTYRKIWYRKKK